MTRDGSCARADGCDIAVSGHEEADVGMPAGHGHDETQRWTQWEISGAGRSVSAAAGGTGRRPRSGGKTKIDRNIRLCAHRPSARCRLDRVKRRSCPAHQSPPQSHRAAMRVALLSLGCFVPLCALLRPTKSTTRPTCPSIAFAIDLVAPTLSSRDKLRPPTQMNRSPSHR